jgi:RNA polymerase sigma-70 factor (ECF subfamily)
MQARGNQLEALLAESQWLHRLAAHLVRSSADADDLVQETFVAVLRRPPDASRPARPWLAEVLRNLARMGARSGVRRRGRERTSGAEAMGATEAADVALERIELQRELAGLVTALEEPYRTAILLRFFEGRASTEIAESLGVADGTVRWRVSEGVRRLRERLDGRDGAGRWRAVLLPLARLPAPPVSRARHALSLKVAAVAGTVAVVGGASGVLLRGHRQREDQQAAQLAAETRFTGGNHHETKEDRAMREATLRKTVILFGLVLPTLASAGEADKPLPREEGIKTCVWYKEVAVQCRNELADYFATFAKPGTPPEVLARYRQKALKEIVEEGTGPLEPRREKCAQDVDKRPITYGDLATLKTCAAQAHDDCKAAVTCAGAFAKRGRSVKK